MHISSWYYSYVVQCVKPVPQQPHGTMVPLGTLSKTWSVHFLVSTHARSLSHCQSGSITRLSYRNYQTVSAECSSLILKFWWHWIDWVVFWMVKVRFVHGNCSLEKLEKCFVEKWYVCFRGMCVLCLKWKLVFLRYF